MMHDSTILLVEDDPADGKLLQRAFEKASFPARLLRLNNGDDALLYLEGQNPYRDRQNYPLPAFIIMDIKLPRRSGLEVLQWLRTRDNTLRRIPVVMLTSSRHSTDVNRAYELGANSYLVKPDTQQELTALMSAVRSYWGSLNELPTV